MLRKEYLAVLQGSVAERRTRRRTPPPPMESPFDELSLSLCSSDRVATESPSYTDEAQPLSAVTTVGKGARAPLLVTQSSDRS